MAAKVYYRQSLTGGGATVLDDVAYAGLSNGDIAFVFTGSTMYTYYFDTSSTAGESSPDIIIPNDATGDGRWLLQAVSVPEEPAGVVKQYAGATAPTGYLLCDGDEVSRTTYADLFAVVSTTYGSGNGSTTFNVPDLRGRVPVGKDNMGGTSANRITASAADTLGGASGAQTHTLTSSQMPSHNHSYLVANSRNDTSGDSSSGTVDRWTNDTTGNTGSTGSNGSHNILQPYIALNYIIRT